eukprot:724578-Rhodomonas_salina.1
MLSGSACSSSTRLSHLAPAPLRHSLLSPSHPRVDPGPCALDPEVHVPAGPRLEPAAAWRGEGGGDHCWWSLSSRTEPSDRDRNCTRTRTHLLSPAQAISPAHGVQPRAHRMVCTGRGGGGGSSEGGRDPAVLGGLRPGAARSSPALSTALALRPN